MRGVNLLTVKTCNFIPPGLQDSVGVVLKMETRRRVCDVTVCETMGVV